MRLIDGEALSERMREKADDLLSQGRYTPAQDCMFVASVVDNAPTVDAIIPVHCEDCRHLEMTPIGLPLCRKTDRIRDMGKGGYCSLGEFRGADNDDFCSYGEAKSGTQPQKKEKK